MAALGALAATAMVVYPGAGDWAVAVGLPLLVAGLWAFGRFQTTAWDKERLSSEQQVAQDIDPIDENALERPWQVTVYADDEADLHTNRQPIEQAERARPVA